MSLKLFLKEGLFKILHYLPEKQGFHLYHKIQDLMNGENMLVRVKSSKGSYEVLEKILKESEFSLKGKKVLEIGSGWAPMMPYFLLYFGKSRSIATFDLNEHFSKKSISRLNEVFRSEYGVAPASSPKNSYGLPEEISYYPNTNLINATLPEADLVFSRFVLEHVKPDDIFLMHQKLKKELKPGSIIVHLISPSDHRAYIDSALSLQDFLQYSESEWQKKQTRFDYHNRLRLPQYIDIFKAAGCEIKHLEYDNPKPNSASLKKFKEVELHKDFKKFSEEELTAGSINVVLKL